MTSNAQSIRTVPGVQILGPVAPEYADILSLPAQAFLAALQRYVPITRRCQNNIKTHEEPSMDDARPSSTKESNASLKLMPVECFPF